MSPSFFSVVSLWLIYFSSLAFCKLPLLVKKNNLHLHRLLHSLFSISFYHPFSSNTTPQHQHNNLFFSSFLVVPIHPFLINFQFMDQSSTQQQHIINNNNTKFFFNPIPNQKNKIKWKMNGLNRKQQQQQLQLKKQQQLLQKQIIKSKIKPRSWLPLPIENQTQMIKNQFHV